MKCIKKENKFMRVPEKMAEAKIKDGWSYCSKSEFKKSEDKETIHRPQQEARVRVKKVKKSRKPAESPDAVTALINKKE